MKSYQHIINDYMVAGHWTRTSLAEASGIGRVNLGNKLIGKTVMTLEEFIRIAKILGISEQDVVRCIK